MIALPSRRDRQRAPANRDATTTTVRRRGRRKVRMLNPLATASVLTARHPVKPRSVSGCRDERGAPPAQLLECGPRPRHLLRPGRVQEEQDEICLLQRGERGAEHRLLQEVAGLQEAGRVHEHHLDAVLRPDAEHPLPRGLRARRHNAQLLADKGVEQRGLADVGRADQGHIAGPGRRAGRRARLHLRHGRNLDAPPRTSQGTAKPEAKGRARSRLARIPARQPPASLATVVGCGVAVGLGRAGLVREGGAPWGGEAVGAAQERTGGEKKVGALKGASLAVACGAEARARLESPSASSLGRRRRTLPPGRPGSTIRAAGLNDRVRDGNGCGPRAMAAGHSRRRGGKKRAEAARRSAPGVWPRDRPHRTLPGRSSRSGD